MDNLGKLGAIPRCRSAGVITVAPMRGRPMLRTPIDTRRRSGASLSRDRSGYLLMRRIDWNPSVWLAFSPVVVAEKGGTSITPSVNDPQINVRCKLIDDFDINFSVTYTVPKHVLCGLPNSPSIRMTKTQCVNW